MVAAHLAVERADQQPVQPQETDQEVLHRIEPCGGVVPVVRVAPGEEVGARHPFLEDERAVGDHRAGPREAFRVGGERRPVHRTGARMRQQGGQIRRGRRERDDDGRIVRRGHAEGLRGLAPGDDVARVRDDVDVLRIARSGGGVHQTAQSGHEIRRHHGVAVGPARLATQLEHIDSAVGAHAPRARHSRRHGGLAVERGQALAQIAQDALRLEAAGLLRIEGVRVGSAAAHQDGRMRRNAGACRPLLARAAASGECGEGRRQRRNGGGAKRGAPLTHAGRVRLELICPRSC